MSLASRTPFYLSVVCLFGGACSDPPCGKNEIKLADTCYPLDERDAQSGDLEGTPDGGRQESAASSRRRNDGGFSSVADSSDVSLEGGRATRAPDAARDPTLDASNDIASHGGTADAATAAGGKDSEVAPAMVTDAASIDSRAEAGSPTPAPVDPTPTPTTPSCTPSMEVCDGRDNDCNGKVDESGMTWYCDADGDEYATNTLGKVDSCAKPAATASCNDWTSRAPSDAQAQDCDDTSPLRFPGASFGLSPTSGGDLNCDGKIETKIEFVWSPVSVYSGTTNYNICPDPIGDGTCGCFAPAVLGKNYRGIDANRKPIFDEPIPHFRHDLPCAQSSGDIVFLMPITRECTQDQEIIVRQLCR